MRKLLLFSGAVLAALPLCAAEPQVLESAQFVTISPNGKYAGSDLFGTVFIYNTETGTRVTYQGDEEGFEQYTLGMGSSISNTGIVVGEALGQPSVLINDEWVPLPVVDATLTNLANAITPDGLRICGSVGTRPISIDEGETPMLVPAVWELLPDGSYGNLTLLPHPDVDLTGRVPQYITANLISADGKTVLGQVTDNSGFFNSLIWYTLGDDNTWTYHESPSTLLNPDNLEFPEFPGDGPSYPTLEQFMSEADHAAYEEAYNAWYDECESTGVWDYSKCPDLEDFASEEAKAAYAAAMDTYEQEYIEWEDKYNAFQEVLDKCQQDGHPLQFNSIVLSADGKSAASSSIRSSFDPMTWSMNTEGGPVAFNLVENTFTVYPENLADPTAMAADGTIFATINDQTNPMRAVVYAPGQTEPVSLLTYIEGKNVELGAWVRENMYHDVEMYDENWEPVMVENVDCTGVPHASASANTIVCQEPNYWEDSAVQVFGYVLPVKDESGVKKLDFSSDIEVRVMRGGEILLGSACDVTVTDAAGRVMFEGRGLSGLVRTGLDSGAYIVKVTKGSERKVIKTTF